MKTTSGSFFHARLNAHRMWKSMWLQQIDHIMVLIISYLIRTGAINAKHYNLVVIRYFDLSGYQRYFIKSFNTFFISVVDWPISLTEIVRDLTCGRNRMETVTEDELLARLNEFSRAIGELIWIKIVFIFDFLCNQFCHENNEPMRPKCESLCMRFQQIDQFGVLSFDVFMRPFHRCR